MTDQKFQLVRFYSTKALDYIPSKDYEKTKNLANNLNRTVYPKGETFIDLFAIDIENTPTFDQLPIEEYEVVYEL